MLRLGIGLAVVVAAYFSFLGWLKKHDAATYQRARAEIARALQADTAEKERAAIEAEEAIAPTPDDPKALAELCDTDRHCRDRAKP